MVRKRFGGIVWYNHSEERPLSYTLEGVDGWRFSDLAVGGWGLGV